MLANKEAASHMLANVECILMILHSREMTGDLNSRCALGTGDRLGLHVPVAEDRDRKYTPQQGFSADDMCHIRIEPGAAAYARSRWPLHGGTSLRYCRSDRAHPHYSLVNLPCHGAWML